jgi:hypothetical protein
MLSQVPAKRFSISRELSRPVANTGRPKKGEESTPLPKGGEGVPARTIGAGQAGSGRSKKTTDNINRFQRGTQADYLTARIARDRPGILDRMKAGEFSSVRKAAIVAGNVKVRKAPEWVRHWGRPPHVNREAERSRITHS